MEQSDLRGNQGYYDNSNLEFKNSVGYSGGNSYNGEFVNMPTNDTQNFFFPKLDNRFQNNRFRA